MNTTFPKTIDPLAGIESLPYPLYASQKLNGLSCRLAPGQVPLSKTNRPLPNRKLATLFSAALEFVRDTGVILEGELYSPTEIFDDLNGAIMSRHRPLPADLQFHAFGCRPTAGQPKDFGRQVAFLNRFVVPLANVEVIPQRLVSDPAQVKKMFEAITAAGGEGVVLRGETGEIIKLKAVETFDGKVIGFAEGKGRLAGTLGAMIVQLDAGASDLFGAGGVEVRVGGGFLDTERNDIWKNKKTYLGRWVEFAGTKVKGTEKPIPTQFLRFRPSDDLGQKI